jgi:hypothetical protein
VNEVDVRESLDHPWAVDGRASYTSVVADSFSYCPIFKNPTRKNIRLYKGYTNIHMRQMNLCQNRPSHTFLDKMLKDPTVLEGKFDNIRNITI